MKSDNYDYLYKIVVIGDSGVGKTNIISRFTTDYFNINNKATIGVEFGHREVKQSDGTVIKLQIWDTAGQERFRAITNAYYRGAVGAIIVFDITKILTFKNVDRWLNEMKRFLSNNIPVLLLGNKVDLKYLREISTESAVTFAQKHGFIYMETSALNGDNIQEAINSLTNTIYEKATKQINDQFESNSTLSIGQKIIIADKTTTNTERSCC